MKYYELDPVAKALHNQTLVNILNMWFSEEYDPYLNPRNAWNSLGNYQESGEGYRVRTMALHITMAAVSNLGHSINIPNYSDIINRFVHLNLKADDFEEHYEAALDQTVAELLPYLGKEDDDALNWEISSGIGDIQSHHHLIDRLCERYVHKWRYSHIQQQLDNAYANDELDQILVEKILTRARELEDPAKFEDEIRDVIKIYSTKIE